MQILTLYISTSLVFLLLDAVMLKSVIHPLFARNIGDLLAPELRLGPAAVFYLAYVAGLIALVSYPALREGVPGQALWRGALVGAMAYGTYEFTNYATLRGWSPVMVATDMAWGTVLTGLAAWAGVLITRAFTS
ncbi:DUF2177 family protein [Frigidibacter sp. MR17.14]|uniref:DUF2177 family protein n=1 Tax=Frigidibacter sp. MR17.14 TaxID=3126509 RepID=UPI003012BE8F